MIDFKITKVNMADREFILYFTTCCDICNIASGQNIKGLKMTRILIKCPQCKGELQVNIIPTIMHTVKNDWAYDPDEIKEVEKKLRGFEKKV